MVPMRVHTRHLSLFQRSHARIRGLASAPFFGLLLVGLLAGCGSGGSGGGSSTQPTTTQTGIIVTTINDASVPIIIGVIADRDWKERITVVGNKDAAGDPINLTEVHYSILGIDITIELGADGLPSVVSDQTGNKYTLTNYTNNTVDILIRS